MTQNSSTPTSPILGSSSFDDNKSEASSTPYEPSPELFKKPTKTIIQTSDDDYDFEEENDNNKKEESSDDDSANKYEEERKKKIERNKMLLANLGLGNGLLPKNNNSTTTKKSRRSTGSESGEPTEVRRSSRLSSKPKPVYNYRELEKVEKESRRVIAQEKKLKKEEQRLKYFSKRTLRKHRGEEEESAEETDEDTYVSEYNENNKRRSSRNKKKIDYAGLEHGDSESEGEFEEFDQVTVVVEESPKKKKKVTKKSTIASPVCSFSNFTISDEHAVSYTEIGGTVAETPSDENITHVVTKVYKRTLKLMCGIIRGAYIVSEDWLLDSLENGYFVDEKPYLIKADGVSLLQARKRALAQPIFADLKFFICDDVQARDIVTQIIETGSGSIITAIDEMLEEDYDFENCYIIYEEEETKDKYPTLPNEVFRTKEFIFTAAVSQKIEDV
ncbi:predicted protein [Naegleria gruberi]|uniref:Predicted protein n=1 Tax=Naegleria gruberi TaxID=5762 RepID=D2VAS6_NAEGR|nr:uncharacterized protein NAEGRDRAFT_65961 [Naegleria gruberi]EFC46001.1 predicted protein [Naegleria gruberi]|eukprot:XP_002678745.1 predicted protein [Naegleria gruberi strain NEG-M]